MIHTVKKYSFVKNKSGQQKIHTDQKKKSWPSS